MNNANCKAGEFQKYFDQQENTQTHVHFATGITTLDDGHFHEFAFATLIENPLGPNMADS